MRLCRLVTCSENLICREYVLAEGQSSTGRNSMAKRHVLLAILIASIGAVTPGGFTDTTSRIVAEEMSTTLGQSLLIDDHAGRPRWAGSTAANAAPSRAEAAGRGA